MRKGTTVLLLIAATSFEGPSVHLKSKTSSISTATRAAARKIASILASGNLFPFTGPIFHEYYVYCILRL